MPREKQIIPKYTFPHEELYINDNTSGALEELVDTTIKYPYLSVFRSAKGIDNTLVSIDSLKKYYKKFGTTNFKKYGQPHLMPEAILSQPDTTVWCMRVMPEDARYANLVISLWYKADLESGKFRIKYTAKGLSVEDTASAEKIKILAKRDLLIEEAKKLDGVAVNGVYEDEEGYTQVPLMVLTAAGRGAYGKNLRFFITRNEDYEKEYGAKIYSMNIIDVENGVTTSTSLVASFTTSPKTSETILINDVIADIENEDLIMHINAFDDNFEAVYNAYVDFCNQMIENDPTLVVNVPGLDEFDPIFGKGVTAAFVRVTPDEPFIDVVEPLTDDVDTSAADFDEGHYTVMDNTVDITSVVGLNLLGGSDGSFATKDSTELQKVVNKCYIDAFTGKLDKLILAPRRIRSHALFDAGYDMEVKFALVKLGFWRSSEIVYLDTGHTETLGEYDISSLESRFEPIYELTEDFENFSDAWIVSLNTHYYYIKEASTGKRVPVTTTYWLAATDATQIKEFGPAALRDGEMATLTGHCKNSLRPAIAENEADLKQALFESRINYFEDFGADEFVRASQSMYVRSNSELIEETNVRALLELKRILEDEFRAKRHKITSPQLRAEFRQFLLEKYSWMIGPYFHTMDIKYRANKYEIQRKITHVYAEVTFPDRSRVTIIEIDVNRKEYEADASDEE